MWVWKKIYIFKDFTIILKVFTITFEDFTIKFEMLTSSTKLVVLHLKHVKLVKTCQRANVDQICLPLIINPGNNDSVSRKIIPNWLM